MAEAALLIGRGLQFASAMVLLGAPLFRLYALGREVEGAGLVRTATLTAAAAGLGAALLVLMGQAASMTGEASDALRPLVWFDVLSSTAFGRAWVVRFGLMLLMAGLALRRSWRWADQALLGVGGLATASLVWMGHGAADEGAAGLAHLLADMAHLLAAAAWLGALAPLLLLVTWARRSRQAGVAAVARRALERFSGVGTAAVAVLVASGLINSWFLIGPTFPRSLVGTPYGLVLSAKLVLFTAMLALAALHRWRSTPALAGRLDAGATPGEILRSLEISLALETALAIGVLGLVAWLGVLAPPGATA